MAIYHLEAKVIRRGAGRSAVAAAAYMSCSQILNDYDGVQHDYTRKLGLVWQQIFLPEYAPAEWSDRGTLWNAVEENEKTKDSRLAREFVVALPIEMGKTEWESLVTEFIQNNFVADGMCADVCIHDTDGHNPHVFMEATPFGEFKWTVTLNEDGTAVVAQPENEQMGNPSWTAVWTDNGDGTFTTAECTGEGPMIAAFWNNNAITWVNNGDGTVTPVGYTG